MSETDATELRPAPEEDASRAPVVLVTGGSRGIGRAICLQFGQAGWRIGIHYRQRREDADRTACAVAECGGEGWPVQADIRSREQVGGMVQQVLERWSRLDVLVCSAGSASSGLVLKTSEDAWGTVIETNLTGTFHCVSAVAEHMLARRYGAVIVVGSFSGIQGRKGQAAYAAAKGGLLGLVKSAAREWGKYNVTVNAIFPGWHATELSREAMPEAADLADHVLGRTPDLHEVARTIYHLAQLKDISGQVWNLDSRIF